MARVQLTISMLHKITIHWVLNNGRQACSKHPGNAINRRSSVQHKLILRDRMKRHFSSALSSIDDYTLHKSVAYNGTKVGKNPIRPRRRSWKTWPRTLSYLSSQRSTEFELNIHLFILTHGRGHDTFENTISCEKYHALSGRGCHLPLVPSVDQGFNGRAEQLSPVTAACSRRSDIFRSRSTIWNLQQATVADKWWRFSNLCSIFSIV